MSKLLSYHTRLRSVIARSANEEKMTKQSYLSMSGIFLSATKSYNTYPSCSKNNQLLIINLSFDFAEIASETAFPRNDRLVIQKASLKRDARR